MIVQLTVKLPDALRRRARAIAARRGETVSDVVRAALESYVTENQNEGEDLAAALEGHELHEGHPIFNLVGIAEGGPPDLSSNKHAYLTD